MRFQGSTVIATNPAERAQWEAVAFDLPHLVDNGHAYGWPRAVARVFNLRTYCPVLDETWYGCYLLATGELLGSGDTKEEAEQEAAYRLQRHPTVYPIPAAV